MAESSDPHFRGTEPDAQPQSSESDRSPQGNSISSQSPASPAGPRPIQRLLSQDRVSRIIPDTNSTAVLSYCSDFVRDFLRSDYLFCTAKMSVATKGKILALDNRFRDANAWMDEKLTWARRLRPRLISLRYDTREVVVTHSLGGRLVRLMNQHDQLFANVLGAYMGGKIDAAEKDNALLGAGRHIRAIHRLCIPDNDRFSRDGTLIGTDC
ncbi:hypothetical protein FOB72_17800 (plasmid) [Cupriavidus pauculus]|uniref:DUF1845 domain-containing protein n=1 Tax=Cupriavidus pauculus TaxID=82633 RepID=A0A5P2H8G5_9BURK|nr:hypothetical protein [Cupriavidus pauculus]QET04008.1 hypothetical protein FOB72_17800 [Cupriavidus pauculus]